MEIENMSERRKYVMVTHPYANQALREGWIEPRETMKLKCRIDSDSLIIVIHDEDYKM